MAVTLAAGHGLLASVLEQAAVGGARQCVVMGQEMEPVLGLPDLRYILSDQDQLALLEIILTLQTVDVPEYGMGFATEIGHGRFNALAPESAASDFVDCPGKFILVGGGDEVLDEIAADRIVPAVTEQLFGGTIPLADPEIPVQKDDGIAGGLQQGTVVSG